MIEYLLCVYYSNIPYQFFQMLSISSLEHGKSTLKLQHAIKEFKRKQQDKSALEHKLNILKQKCQTNLRKAKNIKGQVNKINHIKSSYLQQKIQVKGLLMGEAQQQAIKITKEKTLRERSKENMNIIRNLIQKEKKEDYFKIKERSRHNQMRITQNFKQSLHQKQRKSFQIKLQEENSKLSQTIYLEKKRLLAHSQSEFQLEPIKAGTQRTKEHLEHMRLLQMEMTEKLRSSRQSLSKSRLSLSNTMR